MIGCQSGKVGGSEGAEVALVGFGAEGPQLEAITRIYREALGLDREAEWGMLRVYSSRWPEFRGLLAVVEDEVVGVGWGTRTGPGEWLHDRVAERVGADHPALVDAWLLNLLAVLPGFQGRGIGSMLHDALLSSLPCARAILCAREENTGARAHYRRRGWQYLEPECLIPAGERQFVVMRRELGSHAAAVRRERREE
jgi:ribosomal protein S18 acetylase RimI-like enzyme